MNTRNRLDKIMTELGYGEVVQGKTDEEVVQMIEREVLPLDDIDETQPFELVKYEIADLFWEKHWISLHHLVSEDKVKTLYELLCDYKRSVVKNDL